MPATGGVTLFLTSPGGAVLNLGTAADAASAWVQTKALDFGETRVPKFLDAIFFSFSNRAIHTNLVVQVYGCDEEEGTFELQDTIEVDESEVAYTDPPGFRWIKLRIYDVVVVERWQLTHLEIWGEFGGEEF